MLATAFTVNAVTAAASVAAAPRSWRSGVVGFWNARFSNVLARPTRARLSSVASLAAVAAVTALSNRVRASPNSWTGVSSGPMLSAAEHIPSPRSSTL
jgi:hypothetical protein